MISLISDNDQEFTLRFNEDTCMGEKGKELTFKKLKSVKGTPNLRIAMKTKHDEWMIFPPTKDDEYQLGDQVVFELPDKEAAIEGFYTGE